MDIYPDGLDSKAKFLKEVLTIELETDLGQYEYIQNGIIKGNYPSIWVKPPSLPTYLRMKPNSGIECVIQRVPEMKFTGMGAGRKKGDQKWYIYLNQFDKNKTNSLAIEKIARAFHGCKITTREQQETLTGLNIEQSLIVIPAWNYYSRY
jgi:hypothetical protein